MRSQYALVVALLLLQFSISQGWQWEQMNPVLFPAQQGTALACGRFDYYTPTLYAIVGGENPHKFISYNCQTDAWSDDPTDLPEEADHVGPGGALAADGSDYIYAFMGGGQPAVLAV